MKKRSFIKSLAAVIVSAAVMCGCSFAYENAQENRPQLEIVDTVTGSVTEEVSEETDANTVSEEESSTEEEVPEKSVSEASEEITEEETSVTSEESEEPETEETEEDAPAEEYRFRSEKLLMQHYDKHGREMGFSSAAEYEKAASAVVVSPDALHKTEAEDGDDIYYIEETNEFVVVSTDGYLRTYFYPDKGKKYFDKQ